MAASVSHSGFLVLLLVGVGLLAAAVAQARPNYRGVPLGPCIVRPPPLTFLRVAFVLSLSRSFFAFWVSSLTHPLSHRTGRT
jgi:hypothetical protein